MNVLIIGFGYAGKRFFSAFKHASLENKINFAYVNKRKVDTEITYYDNLQHALDNFRPNIIVISTTDNQHITILEELIDYNGFIVCEKPLATSGDDWRSTCKKLKHIEGFALNLVERYSFATILLKSLIKEKKWSLVRASFFWGKNRINDYRPTCGVISEVIHPLDLITWICDDGVSIDIKTTSGVSSDFSISGSQVLDTVLLTAELNGTPITGYSSFVNIHRQRNVDFSFADMRGEIFHARITYDTPSWDCDHIKIWSIDSDGSENVLVEKTQECNNPELATILKLSVLCHDVLSYIAERKPPSQPFPGLETAIQLQEILDKIQRSTVTTSPANYIRHGERKLLLREAALEILG